MSDAPRASPQDSSENETNPRRLAAMLDGLREGFQIIDRDWRYVYVNPVAAAHGRHQPHELMGRAMGEVYPGIENTTLFAELERAMRDRTTATFENQFTFPDGRTRWFEVRVQPTDEGICVYSRDIEARKARESADAHDDDVDTQLNVLLRVWKTLVGGSADSWR